MKAIIGLGNPGKEYEKTRHNVGFLVVDTLAERFDGEFTQKRSLEAEVAEVIIEGERVLLVKPQTFMNASGRAFAALLSKFPITPQDVLVVHDDADLPFADVRVKMSGGSAGHKGVESIIGMIPKGASIARLRIGIGRPPYQDVPLDEFVLDRWTDQEKKQLPEIVKRAVDMIEVHLSHL